MDYEYPPFSNREREQEEIVDSLRDRQSYYTDHYQRSPDDRETPHFFFKEPRDDYERHL